MLKTEITINQFQIQQFEAIFADIPEGSLYRPGAGHLHPPVWIAGHLTIVAELGQKILGGDFSHPRWIPLFGMGSTDQIPESVDISKGELMQAVRAEYGKLQELCGQATAEKLDRPHGIAVFANTPLQTNRDALAVMLTNHFGFHLAQLSSCRRETGLSHLF
ncbi:DinB family protein [bacterium]|nr:DinB family protein [bacterium]